MIPNPEGAESQESIFRRGSKTYFNSSLLFPPQARRDVTILYAFVRVADDFVDDIPPKPEEFYRFRDAYRRAKAGTLSGERLIDDFVDLEKRKSFEPDWTEDFFTSMESDLVKKTYDNLDAVKVYIWGSAEVIGLFLCRILGLPREAEASACRLGMSMQFINFLRDVAEDHKLGRRYIPLVNTSLPDLSPETCAKNPEEFKAFFRAQNALYRVWQAEGAAGYGWLPRRYLIAIKTASDLYNWTARVIHRNPLVVWQRKVKPSKLRILLTAIKNLFYFPKRFRPANGDRAHSLGDRAQ